MDCTIPNRTGVRRLSLRAGMALSYGVLALVAFTAGCDEPPRGTPDPVSTEVAFRLPEKDLIPEGIAFDEVRRSFFVSSVYKAKIVEVDEATGTSRDFFGERQHGFWGGVGLEVDPERRILWAASAMGDQTRNFVPEEDGLSGLFKFSLEDGALIKKYTLANQPEKHLLNDLVVAQDGTAYITDTLTASVYIVSPEEDELELFLRSEDIAYPNGICLSPDEETLFVANDRGIASVSRSDKSIRWLDLPNGVRTDGIDGLYFYRSSLVAVQNHKGLNRVARFHIDESLEKVLEVEVLLEDHPSFDIPTTGVIVDGVLFVIANSQLRRYDENRRLLPLEELHEPVILRIPLGN